MKDKNEFQFDTDFDGVFRFTNATKEDFIALWNNKEYFFPAGTMCPIIIPDETLENIQAIRKKFAFRLAVREFYKTKEYVRMSKMGNGLPPTFDEKILQQWIDQCLSPLPSARLSVRQAKKIDPEVSEFSQAIGEKDNPNFVFKDVRVEEKGKMPNTPVSF